MRLPVRLDNRVVAVLNFASKQYAAYGSVDLAIGRRIADYVALAMSHQRLAEESRRASALEERAKNLEVLDGLGIGSFDLLGVSWGGFVARQTASVATGRVRKLVLLVPAIAFA